MAKQKRIFASLDDYLLPSSGLNRVGRNMANHFFFCALMRYGSFDEYHFFLANEAHFTLFWNSHESFFDNLNIKEKVRMFVRTDLLNLTKAVDYTVIHASDHITFFNPLCRVRSNLGITVPITAFIHSISYQEHMGRYLEMTMCGASEYDSILCSSSCGKTVVDNCFDKISNNFNMPRAKVRTDIMPLGIDEKDYHPKKADARHRLGIKQTEIIGLCFGRFSDFDKMDLFPLLQAFRSCAKPGHRLILAGAVHEKSYLDIVKLWAQALGVLDNIIFVIDPDEVVKTNLYHSADFFVSLADNPQETYGLTLLEALNARLPLIVSDFNGYSEICGDDVGIRIPTTWDTSEQLELVQPIMDPRSFHRFAAQSVSIDMDSLVEALNSMFTSSSLRSRLSNAAEKRFADKYAHKKIIKKLEEHWINLKEKFISPLPKEDPLAMNLFGTFKHYVTNSLDVEDAFQTTQLATSFSDSDRTYPVLSGMNEMIDYNQVKNIIAAAKTKKPMKNLIKDAQGEPWKARYVISWMLKHGLLTKAK